MGRPTQQPARPESNGVKVKPGASGAEVKSGAGGIEAEPGNESELRAEVTEAGLRAEVTEAGLKAAVTPVGRPPAVSATDSALPLVTAVLMVEVAVDPAATDAEAGESDSEKSLPPVLLPVTVSV